MTVNGSSKLELKRSRTLSVPSRSAAGGRDVSASAIIFIGKKPRRGTNSVDFSEVLCNVPTILGGQKPSAVALFIMTPISEDVWSAMTDAIDKDLLRDLWLASWETASQKIIDDLGAAVVTNRGLRRLRNEDRTAIAMITSVSGEKFAVALLCDGVGGSEMGDVAATVTIAAFIGELIRLENRLPLNKLLENTLRKVDDVVRTALKGQGMTTASIAIASSTGQLAAVNVGDSRIFSWKPKGSRFEQVSIDDTIENELKLKDAAVLDAHGLRGTLSQAVGETGRCSSDLRVVILDKLTDGLILASDGAWKGGESGFKSIALNASSASEAAKRMLAFAMWTGGSDNISIIAIEDLMKLAEQARQNPEYPSSGSGWVSIWFCDTKLIMSHSCNPKAVSKEKNYFSAQQARLGKGKKQKRKSRDPNSSLKPLSDSDKQLNLTGDVEIRPRIEVSTDDGPPSLY